MYWLGAGRGHFGRKDASEFNGNIFIHYICIYMQIPKKIHEFTF